MSSSSRTIARVGLALLCLMAMRYYVQQILIPYQEKDAALHDRPRGNLSDLYPRWLGARELLLHGRDPYSPEITREIQEGFYGRPIQAGRPGDPTDQAAFAYPVYVVFLLAPTVTLPFSFVQEAFFWLLLLLTLASVPLWLMFMRWRPTVWTVAVMGLLTIGSFPVVQGLRLQQLSLLVAALVALSAALLSRGNLFSAGVLMGFASIKPQLVVPIAGWLLLWAFSDLRRRRRYVVGFAVTAGAFAAGSEWFLKGWMGRFADAVAAYQVYAGTGSLLDVLITPTWGRLFAALLVTLVVFLCWRSRKVSENQPEFFWITSLILTVTVVIVPMIVPYNQVLLLPAILFLVRHRVQLWSRSLLGRVTVVVSGVVILWQWIGAGALLIWSAFASPAQVQRWWAAPLYASIVCPLFVLTLQLLLIGQVDDQDGKGAKA